MQVLDNAFFISEKYWFEICLPLKRPSETKDAGFVMLCFGQLPFFRVLLKYEGHGRAVTGALLKTEMLEIARV